MTKQMYDWGPWYFPNVSMGAIFITISLIHLTSYDYYLKSEIS